MEQASMLKASRLDGTLRYFTRKVLECEAALVMMALAASLLGYGIQVFTHSQGSINSLSFLFNSNGAVLIVLCVYAVYSETRYLAITPEPRFIIYLGVLWKILFFAAVSSVVAALHSVLDVVVAQAVTRLGLAQIAVEVYDFDLYRLISGAGEMNVARTLGEVARLAAVKVPRSILQLVELGGFWYLYLCLLRRWKIGTLAVTIGTPIVLMTLMIVPMFTGWMDVIASMSEEEIMRSMPALYNLYNSLVQALRWLAEEWPAVRAVLALGCYLLAYPVMRGTPQPN